MPTYATAKWVPVFRHRENKDKSPFLICQIIFNILAIIVIFMLIVVLYRERHKDDMFNPRNFELEQKFEACELNHPCMDFGEPVCGSNGLMYEDLCSLKVAACQFPEMKLVRANSTSKCKPHTFITLVGGKTPFEGNVYARHPRSGIFGPVCDDAWRIEAAQVACLHLGFKRALKFSIESYFGKVTPRFSFDDVKCTGHEYMLDHCRHRDDDDCAPDEGAGVVCDPGVPPPKPSTTTLKPVTTTVLNGTTTTFWPGFNTSYWNGNTTFSTTANVNITTTTTTTTIPTTTKANSTTTTTVASGK